MYNRYSHMVWQRLSSPKTNYTLPFLNTYSSFNSILSNINSSCLPSRIVYIRIDEINMSTYFFCFLILSSLCRWARASANLYAFLVVRKYAVNAGVGIAQPDGGQMLVPTFWFRFTPPALGNLLYSFHQGNNFFSFYCRLFR